MKIRELMPFLTDTVAYFMVYDSSSGDLIYDGSTHEKIKCDVGDTDIRYVYFKECEGDFPNTTNTICVITAPYYEVVDPDVAAMEEVIICALRE
jgi:hypothetical protein